MRPPLSKRIELAAGSAAALTGVLVAVTLGPGIAEAKPKGKGRIAVKTRTATDFSSSHASLLSVVATCPKRRTALGGGYSSGLLAAGADLDVHLVYESRRLDHRRWIVSGGRIDTDGAGNPLPLTAYARCGKPKRGKLRLSSVSASVPLLPGAISSATTSARCPGKRQVLSGGFSSSPPPALASTEIGFVTESRRTAARRWTVTAGQFSPTTRTLTVSAYCARMKKPRVRSSSAFLAGAARSTAALDTPRCPRRRPLAAAGFYTTVASLSGSAAEFIASTPSGRRGHLLALQGVMGSGASVTAHAYCL